MKRLLCLMLIAATLAGTMGESLTAPAYAASASLYLYTPADDNTKAKARNFSLQYDKFMLDGKEISVDAMFRYEFIHMPEAVAGNADYAWEWFDLQTPKPLSDRCPKKNSVYTFGAADGDVIYLREKDADSAKTGNQPGNWTTIKVISGMMAMSAGNGHLVYMDKPTEFTIKAENPYTSYEYAVQMSGVTYLEWLPAGTADETTLLITGYTLPRSGRYTILVRVAGDSKAANYRDCVGRIYDKAVLDLRSENIALGGVNKLEDTVYQVTIKGKKTIYNVAPGTDHYIPLGKVFGNNNVEIRVEMQMPVEATAASGKAAKDQEIPTQVLISSTVKARPQIGKGVTQSAYISNLLPDNWTLQADAALSFEYGPAIKGNALWTQFDRKTGLPLLTAAEQKAGRKAASYFIRIAPNEQTMTPASKEKKFNQIKQVKSPTLKPDYKKELLKIKAGMFYYIGKPSDDLTQVTFTEAGATPTINISEAINNDAMIFIYTPSNGKKSRSAVQRIQLAPRFIAVDNGEGGLLSSNGKVKLEKGFEAYNEEKGKWGAMPKGVNSVQVRKKSTAKYNAKTGVNTGSASSPGVLFALTYDGKKVISASCRSKAPSGLTALTLRVQSGADKFDMPFTVAQNDYVLGLRAGARTASFTLEAAGAGVEVMQVSNGAAIGDLKVTSYGKIIVTGAKPGAQLRIVTIPHNQHEQRSDVYTVTVGMPFAAAPQSVVWREEAGGRGRFAVTFAEGLGPQAGDVIQWDLYARPGGDASKEEWIYQGLYTVTAEESGASEFTMDCAATIRKNDRELELVEYRVSARVLASDVKSMSPETSTGTAAAPNLLVTRETLGLDVVNLFGPLGPHVPLFAPERNDELQVYALDGLGNKIDITGASIQWYRVDSPLEEPSGEPFSRQVKHVLGFDDVGYYIKVIATLNGNDTRTFSTIGRVAGYGSNLTILHVENGRLNGGKNTAFKAGLAFTTFPDGGPPYDIAQVDIDGLQRVTGGITLTMAENSLNATAQYAMSDTKLTAEPVWTDWPVNGLNQCGTEYLYIRMTGVDGTTPKMYCFRFAVLDKPTLTLSADPPEVDLALNEVAEITANLKNRNDIPLYLTQSAGEGLVAVIGGVDDDILSVSELSINGDFISFKVQALSTGLGKVRLYVYPTAIYVNRFHDNSFNTHYGIPGTQAVLLEIPIYVSALAPSERE